MIKQCNNVFELHTQDTTYCFHILPSGHLEHLYYGGKVDFKESYEAVMPKCEFIEGNLIAYDEAFGTIALENRCLEVSTRGKGDIREPMIDLTYLDGSSTCDFLYTGYRILETKKALDTLPSAYDEQGEAQSLEIELMDEKQQVKLLLTYSVFEKTNVIVRSAQLMNASKVQVKVNRLFSASEGCSS